MSVLPFLLLFLALFLFLFCFYYFIQDDFHFIRKGITLEQLFNVLFLGLFFNVFIARIVRVFIHPSEAFLNPLAFIFIPGFSDIPFFESIVGLFIIFIFLTRQRKMNAARFLDYVSLSLLCALPVSFLGSYFLQEKKDVFIGVYIPVIYFVLFLFFANVLFKKFARGSLKEGSIAALFLVMVSLVSLIEDILMLYTQNRLLQIDDALFASMFVLASIYLLRLESKRTGRVPS